MSNNNFIKNQNRVVKSARNGSKMLAFIIIIVVSLSAVLAAVFSGLLYFRDKDVKVAKADEVVSLTLSTNNIIVPYSNVNISNYAGSSLGGGYHFTGYSSTTSVSFFMVSFDFVLYAQSGTYITITPHLPYNYSITYSGVDGVSSQMPYNGNLPSASLLPDTQLGDYYRLFCFQFMIPSISFGIVSNFTSWDAVIANGGFDSVRILSTEGELLNYWTTSLIYQLSTSEEFLRIDFFASKYTSGTFSYTSYFMEDRTYYFNQSNGDYNTGYNDGLNQGYINGRTSGYESGYADGRLSGLQEGSDNAYNIGYEDGYDEGWDSGRENGFDFGWNSGYVAGDSVGYNRGVAEANDYSFLGLLGAVVDAPVKSFTGLLNFDLLGFNMLNFFTGLLTLALILWVVSKILGGK